MSLELKPGEICYSWVPYSKDQTNRLLGSIVQVKLLEPFSLGWSAEVCAASKPTSTLKRGDKLYLIPSELYGSASDVVSACKERYAKYMDEHSAALLKAGA